MLFGPKTLKRFAGTEFKEVGRYRYARSYLVRAIFALSARKETNLDHRVDGEIDHKQAENQRG